MKKINKISKISLNMLRTKCKRIDGVRKVRINRENGAVHLYFHSLFSRPTTDSKGLKKYDFKTVVHLDDWDNGVEMAKAEYGRFFTGGIKNGTTY